LLKVDGKTPAPARSSSLEGHVLIFLGSAGLEVVCSPSFTQAGFTTGLQAALS
jgi:hypothetical protein